MREHPSRKLAPFGVTLVTHEQPVRALRVPLLLAHACDLLEAASSVEAHGLDFSPLDPPSFAPRRGTRLQRNGTRTLVRLLPQQATSQTPAATQLRRAGPTHASTGAEEAPVVRSPAIARPAPAHAPASPTRPTEAAGVA